jgi:hypothetical protein
MTSRDVAALENARLRDGQRSGSRREDAREAVRLKRTRANSNVHPQRSKRREPDGPLEAPTPYDAARRSTPGSRRHGFRGVRVQAQLDRGALESASTADKSGFLGGDSGDRVASGHFVLTAAARR